MRREFGQDAAFLVACGQFQFTDFIVELHDRQRLDEERGTGGGLVVHDRLDLALELGAERDHVAPIALGDDRFLQLVSGVGQISLQARHQPVVGDSQLTADVRQPGRGRIEHLAALGEHTRDGIDKAERFRQAGGRVGQMRRLILRVLQAISSDRDRR